MTPAPDDSLTTACHPDGGVLVGDDGSADAAQAVRAAAEEAHRRGVTLHVLRAWRILSADRPDEVPPGVVPSLAEFEAATLATERTRVAGLLAGLPEGPAGVPVEVHVVHAAATKALLEASQSADLLVLGARGVGGFARLMLGSTADQVLRYAACSVLVARERRAL